MHFPFKGHTALFTFPFLGLLGFGDGLIQAIFIRYLNIYVQKGPNKFNRSSPLIIIITQSNYPYAPFSVIIGTFKKNTPNSSCRCILSVYGQSSILSSWPFAAAERHLKWYKQSICAVIMCLAIDAIQYENHLVSFHLFYDGRLLATQRSSRWHLARWVEI